jgi:hypothetical protein
LAFIHLRDMWNYINKRKSEKAVSHRPSVCWNALVDDESRVEKESTYLSCLMYENGPRFQLYSTSNYIRR